MSETGKIHGAMLAVMKAIGAIGKNSENKFQHYKFRGIDSVYNAVNAPMIEHGVFCVAEVLESKVVETKTTKDKLTRFATVRMRYTFTASDGSSVCTESVGEGMDSGDKAVYKAMAGAQKYAIIQAFCIPTEEQKDAESDSHKLTSKKADSDYTPPIDAGTPIEDGTPFIVSDKPATLTEAVAHIEAIDNIPRLKRWFNKNRHVMCDDKGDVKPECVALNNVVGMQLKHIQSELDKASKPPEEISDVEPF